MAGFTIPTIFSAVDKLSAPLRKMSKNMQSFASRSEAGVARLDRRLRKLTPSLGGLQRQMLAFASAGAIIAGIGGAINIVKDYEQANADLAAVMNTTKANQKILGDDAQRLGAITAKSATEVVGLQEAFARLGFETPQIVNMTEATIAGSIAMNAELADTAELTGAMVKTFDDFSSIDAPAILDKMTLSTQKSALSFEKLQTALPIVGGAANAAGISFENTLALLGKLSDAGIDASSSSTALRNIFLDSAKKGHSYSEILENIEKNQDKLTAANDEFGKRGAVSAAILAKGLDEVAGLTNTLTNDFEGTAQAAADTRLDTFGGSLTLLSSAYEGLILDISNSTGALGGFKFIIQFVTENIKTLATILGVAVGAFLALKIGVLAAQGALWIYRTAMLISAIATGTMTKAIAVNEIALGAYTAVQWLANAALFAFPVVWIIAAFIAVGAAIVALIVYWEDLVKWVTESDSVFAKLVRVALLPAILTFKAIGFVVGWVIEKFGQLIDWVKTSDSGFAQFIRGTIGAVINHFKMMGEAIGIVIDAFATMWDWISNFTSEALAPIMSVIDMFSEMTQSELGVDVNKNVTGEIEAVNPEAVRQEALTTSITEQTNKEKIDLNLTVNGEPANVDGGGSSNNVNVSSTMTGGQ